MDSILEIVQALFNGCGVVYFSVAAFIGVLLGPVYFTIKRSYPSRSVLAFYIALSVAPSVFGFDHGAITLPALVVIPIGMKSRSLALVALSVALIFATWVSMLSDWAIASIVFREKNGGRSHVGR